MTLTFDLLTSKSIGHILASWGVCMWSFMMIGIKGKQLCAGDPNAAGQTDGQTDGRTDGQTDGQTDGRTWWFQYTPPNFVAGGYKKAYINQKYLFSLNYLNSKTHNPLWNSKIIWMSLAFKLSIFHCIGITCQDCWTGLCFTPLNNRLFRKFYVFPSNFLKRS